MTVAKNRAEILARARHALMSERRDAAICARGTGQVHGVPVRWTRTCDPSGRVVEIMDGRLGHRAGFDGRVGWRVDETGMPGSLDLGDLEAFRVLAAVWSGIWADEGGVVRVGEIVTVDESRIVLALCLRDALQHPGSLRLTLDARTALPRSVERVGRDDTVTSFDDFRAGELGLVPHRIVHREGWLADTLEVESVERAPDTSYALTASDPEDTTFDETAASPVWRRTRNGLLLARPRVNGRDVGWFVLDTGASVLAIDALAAETLALPGAGRRAVRTADGLSGARYRRAEELRVGGLAYRAPLLLEVDLGPFGQASGVKLAGVLGYDLFRRAAVTLDVDEGVVIARSPPPVHGDEASLPLRFEDRTPVVVLRHPAPSGPREGLFAIDTGSGVALTAVAGAASALELRGGARASLRGLGGTVEARRRSMAWLELAHHRMEEIDVVVPVTGEGALGGRAPGGILGYLGMGLLREFTVTFDYRGAGVRLRRKKRGLRRALEG
jgi:hypothetical protein